MLGNHSPFHAITLVGGIARQAGWRVDVHDVNIDFHNHVTPEERESWEGSKNHVWFGKEHPAALWEKYLSVVRAF